MARSVETIAAHAILLVEIIRKGIHICLLRHGLMESRIEYAHLRQTRHQFRNSMNTLQVGWVVQRSQIDASLESFQHFVVEHHALVEFLAAVHHAMAHCVNLLQVFNHADFRICQQREDELHAFRMLGNVVHNLLLLTVCQFHFHECAIHAHALCAARCHHFSGIHVVQSVLDGTTTAI